LLYTGNELIHEEKYDKGLESIIVVVVVVVVLVQILELVDDGEFEEKNNER
jgi:hypothetical protein